MRIIGGTFKGRRLHPPRTLPVRPTTDMAKESLFNILSNRFDFSALNVADLFAGTGSISYEFASRGCSRITAVEIHPACIRFMKETATMLGIEGIKIVRNDVFRFIRKAGTPCDIVFADPPYDLGSLPGLPGLVLDHNLLVPGGWLILEHSSRISFHGHPCFVEQRVYGEVNFTFFQKGTGLVRADQQKSV